MVTSGSVTENARESDRLTHSIVIPTVGRVEPLLECMASIARQRLVPEEVIVVPCRDAVGIKRALGSTKNPFALKVVESDGCNASLQKNLGAKHANCDIVHFLDDDVELDPAYVDEIDATFRLNRGVVGVGGKVIDAQARWPVVLRMIRRVFLLNHDNGRGDFLPSGFPAMPFDRRVDVPVRVRLLMGCASYRRNVLESFQYDEELGRTHLWEDLDLPATLSRNHLLLYQPNAVLVHHHAPGGRPDVSRYAYAYLYNHHYLVAKHGRRGVYFTVSFWWGHLGAWAAMVFRAMSGRVPLWPVVSSMFLAERDWLRRKRELMGRFDWV
ncbi:hypothetical protein LIP_2247 [Limnochorda pilosa]|uniref:Glycosyltransferase 2-like domain-containing protein n=1 Tax=Limnochorda pilosa TaxID=1555112 RepID=A0A0K2SLU3_LIMPI|nr:glycosyltransferase [Limnochorda pilosa]BAS28088.1 hypothetical protein LIP_2247 [Limnochorda pilosa]